jgi:hypothetical protein
MKSSAQSSDAAEKADRSASIRFTAPHSPQLNGRHGQHGGRFFVLPPRLPPQCHETPLTEKMLSE